MTSISELDRTLGREDARPSQEKFFFLPVFDSMRLLEGAQAKVTQGNEIINKKQQKGTAVSISDMEVVIPFLLQETGALNNQLERWSPSEHGERASRVGSELHSADSMFNALVQGMGGKAIPSVFPTENDTKIEKIQAGTDQVVIEDDDNQEAVEKKLLLAWERYADPSLRSAFSSKPSNYSFFPTTKDIELRDDPQLYAQVREGILNLAKSWARQMFSPQPMTWEFLPNAFSYREIFIPLNFPDFKLQMRGRLDSVSRNRKEGEMLQGQLIDLKTGTRKLQGGLAKEIRVRQSQMMWYMAERFAARYLRGEKFFEEISQMKARGEGFNLSSTREDDVYSDRLNKVAYRWFNPQTGEMELEEVGMDETARHEFEDWLAWFGPLVHLYKLHISQLRGVQFKLPTE